MIHHCAAFNRKLQARGGRSSRRGDASTYLAAFNRKLQVLSLYIDANRRTTAAFNRKLQAFNSLTFALTLVLWAAFNRKLQVILRRACCASSVSASALHSTENCKAPPQRGVAGGGEAPAAFNRKLQVQRISSREPSLSPIAAFNRKLQAFAASQGEGGEKVVGCIQQKIARCRSCACVRSALALLPLHSTGNCRG